MGMNEKYNSSRLDKFQSPFDKEHINVKLTDCGFIKALQNGGVVSLKALDSEIRWIAQYNIETLVRMKYLREINVEVEGLLPIGRADESSRRSGV